MRGPLSWAEGQREAQAPRGPPMAAVIAAGSTRQEWKRPLFLPRRGLKTVLRRASADRARTQMHPGGTGRSRSVPAGPLRASCAGCD
jgi:hypothetical protein